MKEQLEKIKTPHGELTFLAMVHDIDAEHLCIAPIPLSPNPVYNDREDWNEWKMKHLNEGIVRAEVHCVPA